MLSELRTALRVGAVWVEGSRRYQPADRYLIAAAAWPARRDAARRALGLPARADERLEQLAVDVERRVAALDRMLADGQVAVDVVDGELHVRRLAGVERPEPTARWRLNRRAATRHVVPDQRTTWRVYETQTPSPLSERTNATDAERAAQARAEDGGAARVVVHARYNRTHDLDSSPRQQQEGAQRARARRLDAARDRARRLAREQ